MHPLYWACFFCRVCAVTPVQIRTRLTMQAQKEDSCVSWCFLTVSPSFPIRGLFFLLLLLFVDNRTALLSGKEGRVMLQRGVPAKPGLRTGPVVSKGQNKMTLVRATAVITAHRADSLLSLFSSVWWMQKERKLEHWCGCFPLKNSKENPLYLFHIRPAVHFII